MTVMKAERGSHSISLSGVFSKSVSVVTAAILLLLFALFLGKLTVVSEYVTEGFKTAVFSVLPSVFPFAVFAEMLIRSDVSILLGKMLGKVFRFLFGVSDECVPALFLGFLCGYPVGAAAIASLLKNGRISRNEASAVFMFVNNPSPAFVVGVVGGMFKNTRIGVLLYMITLFSAFICGLFCRFFIGNISVPFVSAKNTSSHSLSHLITKSITSASGTALLVCGYIAFFRAIGGITGDILAAFGANATVITIASGFLEISVGISAASLLEGGISFILSAVFCAWSGVCVIFQVMAVGGDISFKPLIIGKTLQSILSAVVSSIIVVSGII